MWNEPPRSNAPCLPACLALRVEVAYEISPVFLPSELLDEALRRGLGLLGGPLRRRALLDDERSCRASYIGERLDIHSGFIRVLKLSLQRRYH